MSAEVVMLGAALVAAIGLAVAAYGAYSLACRRRERRVLEESARLAALRDLNASVSFRDVGDVTLKRRLSTPAQFSRFDSDAFVMAAIGEDRGYFETWVKDVEYDQKLRLVYEGRLDGLPASQYGKESWREAERKAFEAQRRTFGRAPWVELTWSYTSPAGRSSSRRSKAYTLYDVKKMLSLSSEEQYDRMDRQASIARERALMTDGLRYDVLRRDGFRCAICGSTAADGVKLEVDHIVPVSKGGRTELSNLQTLCDRCNRGKSDKM